MFSINCMMHWCNTLLCYCGFCYIASCCSCHCGPCIFSYLYSFGLYFSGSINYYCTLSICGACSCVIFKCHHLTFFFLHLCSVPVFRALFCFCVIADVTFVSDYCDRIQSGWRRSSTCLRPTRNSMRRYIADLFFQASLFCYVEMANTVGEYFV